MDAVIERSTKNSRNCKQRYISHYKQALLSHTGLYELIIQDYQIRDDPNYHPLQNILQGVLYLKDKSCGIIPGKEISINEGKINKYHTFNVKKISQGCNVYKVV